MDARRYGERDVVGAPADDAPMHQLRGPPLRRSGAGLPTYTGIRAARWGSHVSAWVNEAGKGTQAAHRGPGKRERQSPSP